MLWAVMPAPNIHAAWALIASPAVPTLLALWCAFEGQRETAAGFKNLKQQIAADLVMLRDVSAA